MNTSRPWILIRRNKPLPINLPSGVVNATIIPKSGKKGLLETIWDRLNDASVDTIEKLFYISCTPSPLDPIQKDRIKKYSRSAHKKLGLGHSWNPKELEKLIDASSLFSLILANSLSNDLNGLSIIPEPEIDIGGQIEFDYAIGIQDGFYFKLFLLAELKRFSSDNNLYEDVKKAFNKFTELHNAGVYSSFLLHLHLSEELKEKAKTIKIIKAAENLWEKLSTQNNSKLYIMITKSPYSNFVRDLQELITIIDESKF